MSKKISNDENIENLKKRKILRWIIMLFALLTIVFALLSLIYDVSIIFSLLAFIITTVLMKVRDNIVINKQDDLKDVRKALNKSKNR